MLIGEEECPRLNVEGGTLNADSDRPTVILKASVNQADDISLAFAQVNGLRSRYQLLRQSQLLPKRNLNLRSLFFFHRDLQPGSTDEANVPSSSRPR